MVVSPPRPFRREPVLEQLVPQRMMMEEVDHSLCPTSSSRQDIVRWCPVHVLCRHRLPTVFVQSVFVVLATVKLWVLAECCAPRHALSAVTRMIPVALSALPCFSRAVAARIEPLCSVVQGVRSSNASSEVRPHVVERRLPDRYCFAVSSEITINDVRVLDQVEG